MYKNQVIDFKKDKWEDICHQRAQSIHLSTVFEKETKKLIAENRMRQNVENGLKQRRKKLLKLDEVHRCTVKHFVE